MTAKFDNATSKLPSGSFLPIHDLRARISDARIAQPALEPFDHIGRKIDAQHVGTGRRREHGENARTGAGYR
jgi:hypothetical protein